MCHTYFNKKDHLWTLYEYETGQFQIPKNAQMEWFTEAVSGNCHTTILPTGDFMCRRVQNSKVGNALLDRSRMSGFARWKLTEAIQSLKMQM